ncbi:MAG: SPOR domain-containing protein [Balneolales bacterium]
MLAATSEHRTGVMISRIVLISVIALPLACASTDTIQDDEMEQLLDEAAEEYGELTEQLDSLAPYFESMEIETKQEIEKQAETLLAELPDLGIHLGNFRSRLSDQHAVTDNDIPAIYRHTTEDERNRSDNRGFRIQLVSTQHSRYAEEVRDDFEEWIRNVTIPPYASTYMVFQQPYYRIQVGDFLDRDKAIEFTEFIRLRFPDAWVIHSTVNPARVSR